GSRVATGDSPIGTTPVDAQKDIRGYIDATGAMQLTPEWSLDGSIRFASDRTFLRRYDISRDDRLRSTLGAQRIGDNSYFSIRGWAVQTLRAGDSQGQTPIALPLIDYRLRLKDPLLGGVLQLQANTLAITRTHGQDTQRAFAAAEWNLRTLTGLGQEVTFTGYLRGDVYHSSDNDLTTVATYAGSPGWQARGIAAAAVDMRWPFVGEAFGGVQRIAPRIQIVAAPRLANLSLPNEDARAVDLEDSNLFALNRFAGYDRFEDSTRITYGLEYGLDLPDFSLQSIVGQSYRLDSRENILPDGTGLSGRTSDIVGRVTARYKDFISLTHRFRADKDNLAVRRNEVDATVGSKSTYVMVGYLRLNRDADDTLEDLQDREEVRLGGRVQFARFWSVFGSTVIDLTDAKEDPLSAADGYEPVRHRLGVAYEDDCLTLGLTWRRDYVANGDARKGNGFQLRLAFRNIGI
ncbi:MAG: LPS-assembly protein LptD, partial [Alphaproteobacteria bacterium]